MVAAQPSLGDWYDRGAALENGEDPALELTGTFGFTSSSGGVHCAKAALDLELTGATVDGHVKSFTAEEPGSCEVSGGLVLLAGGTTKLKAITLTGEPTAAASEEKQIELSGISLHYEFANGFAATMTSKGGEPLLGTPDDPAEIASVAVAGKLNTTLSSGIVSVAGALNVVGADKGTYGVEEGEFPEPPPPENDWYDLGVGLALGEDPSLSFSGTFHLSFGSLGAVNCGTVVGKLQLTGGTSDGHLQTLAVKEPAACEVSGGLATSLGGTTSVKAVTLTGAPTATASEKSISLSNIELDYEFKNETKMVFRSLAEEPLTLVPDNNTSIKSFTATGLLRRDGFANVSVEGTWTVNEEQAGTFGLVS